MNKVTLDLISKLKEAVNSKEEYDYLCKLILVDSLKEVKINESDINGN